MILLCPNFRNWSSPRTAFRIALPDNSEAAGRLTRQLGNILPCGRAHQYDRYFYSAVCASITKN